MSAVHEPATGGEERLLVGDEPAVGAGGGNRRGDLAKPGSPAVATQDGVPKDGAPADPGAAVAAKRRLFAHP